MSSHRPHPKPTTPSAAPERKPKPAAPLPAPELAAPAPLEAVEPTDAACGAERPSCPVCHVAGVEKLQKWFCPRCRRLLQTCCD
ncbi:MAG: hypothetical protein NTW19_22855 [Planctomycetota bacterium]|nr:hypothetical protein [Planctomycetota bacterium]